MILDGYVAPEAQYQNMNLAECAQAILTGLDPSWEIRVDPALTVADMKLVAFRPGIGSVRYQLMKLAEAYIATLSIDEPHLVVHFRQNLFYRKVPMKSVLP